MFFFCHFTAIFWHRMLDLVCQEPGKWDIKIEACLSTWRERHQMLLLTKVQPLSPSIWQEGIIPNSARNRGRAGAGL